MTPAERECEACGYPWPDAGAVVGQTAMHFNALHRQLAEKDARIRELEGTLRFIATEWDLKPIIKELRSRAEAALARSEGGGK